MAKTYLQKQMNRFSFFRSSYRMLVYSAWFFAVANLGLLGVIYYKTFTLQKPSYFAATSDGRVIETFPD